MRVLKNLQVCAWRWTRQDSSTLDRNAAAAVRSRRQRSRTIDRTTRFLNSRVELGVLFDEQLNMADHVTAVCKSGFFQLRQLRLIRSCLTMDLAKTLVHAFISSRLDYCNSLLVGAADCVIRKLQGVQNAANLTTSYQSCGICTGFRFTCG